MNRRYEYDLCRIAACIMVIIIHAGADVYQMCRIDIPAFIPLNFVSTLVRGSVPVFFMLSGALLLDREEMKLRGFLKNHPLRLTGIFFLWSLIYALISRLVAGSFGSAYDFFMDLARGHYHMWFLPAMIVCYLFMPPLWSALHGKKLDVRYAFFLFVLFGLVWRNCNLTPRPTYILHQLTLHLDLNHLIYLGYAVWGYMLAKRELPKKTLIAAPLVFLVVTAVTAAANRWYSGFKGEADGWFFNYLSLPSFLQATSMFCFFSALRGREFKCAGLIRALSECTLGVYLMHPMVISALRRLGLEVTTEAPTLSLLTVTALSAAICFAVSYAAKKIPIVKKLL